MGDDEIERQIQAKGLTAARVTPEDIQAAIAWERGFNLGALVSDSFDASFVAPPEVIGGLDLVSIHVLVLRNGTKVVGVNTGPVSPQNFDEELGAGMARQNAIDQVWPMLGYELRSRLAAKEA